MGIADSELQEKLAKRVKEGKLNVRQVEELVRQENKKQKAKPRRKAQQKDPEVLAVESRLRDYFSTKVNISHSGKKGKIEIEYYNQEDLNRILDRLNGNE